MRWAWTTLLLASAAFGQNAYGPDFLNLHCTTPDPFAQTLFNIQPRPGLVPDRSPNGNVILYCDSSTGTLKTSVNGGAYSNMVSGTVAPFVPYINNPILAPTGGETQIFMGSMLKVGSSFVCYYSYELSGVTVIGRCTSPDGKTITRDTVDNPVFNVGVNGTFDASYVATPVVWTENGGASYNMLYTAEDALNVGRIGLATSTDGINWTRFSGNNCTGTTGNGCVIDKGIGGADTTNVELTSIIKVGGTYYGSLSHFSRSTARQSGVVTSTDLHNWTKDANNPTFTGGFFDGTVWTQGGAYFMAIAHYTATGPNGTDNAELDLYRDVAPTFYPNSRTFLGVLWQNPGVVNPSGAAEWDAFLADEPFILTDDVTRSTFNVTSGSQSIYYSSSPTGGHGTFAAGILIANSAAPAWGTNPQAGAFPYGIQTPNICVGCSAQPGLSAGIYLGYATFNTPIQIFSGFTKNAGTQRPNFVANSAGDFWGIGPASIVGDNVIQIGTVAGVNTDWSATNDMVWNAKGYAIPITATAALTAGQVVKVDSANTSAVVVTVTTDTGGGIPVGVVQNSPGAGATAYVIIKGISTFPILGTGTCSIGNFVIVDTTTNGRVKCTGTYTAGTIIGTALTAQASVGSAVSVLVAPR